MGSQSSKTSHAPFDESHLLLILENILSKNIADVVTDYLLFRVGQHVSFYTKSSINGHESNWHCIVTAVSADNQIQVHEVGLCSKAKDGLKWYGTRNIR